MRNMLARPVTGYSLLLHLLVCVALTVAALFVSLTVNKNSERKFCDLVQAQVAAYKETPPTTDTGKNLAKKYDILRKSISC